MSTANTDTPASGPPAPRLADSLHRVLADPLSALRASMESVISEIGREAPHGRILEGALAEVTRLARDVQTLVELAEPRPLAPLSCSFDEVTHVALRHVAETDRPRVDYARPPSAARLWVDGPTLSTSLETLLACVLEGTSGRVLLQVRQDDLRSRFVLVLTTPARDFDPTRLELDGSPREAARSVRVAVAQRDIARMGGELHVESTELGATCVCIDLPTGPTSSGQLEEQAA